MPFFELVHPPRAAKAASGARRRGGPGRPTGRCRGLRRQSDRASWPSSARTRSSRWRGWTAQALGAG